MNKQIVSRKPAILGGGPMFDRPVPITAPTIPPINELKERYEKVLRSGMITNSVSVQEFEKRAAEYIGVKHAIAVSSCTSGLMLIMRGLEIKGEVILPSFTFHATAHAVIWNGLKPVFVDCDPETYNIDPAEVKKAITAETSAIIGVHIFGNPAPVDELQRIASAHNLHLLFDAAHGFGTVRRGKRMGGFGDAESFSLSPTKLLTAGEGGIVTTNSDEVAGKVRVGRNYGDAGDYDPTFSGLSARMSEFNALLGIESLKMLETNVARRNELATLYLDLLSAVPGITFQKIEKGNRSSYKDLSILIDPEKFGLTRDQLSDCLTAENIVVKKYFFPPVHMQKAFADYHDQDRKMPNTMRISLNSLSLPLYSHMEHEKIGRICSTVKAIHDNSKLIGEKLAGRKSA